MLSTKEKTVKPRGLSTQAALDSIEKHGKNILPAAKRRSFAAHLLSNLSDPVIRILLFALAVNVFFALRGGDIYESIGIAVSIFLASFISTMSERGSEAAFARLSEQFDNAKHRVRRDGRISELDITELAVGDVVLLGAGENVPADAFVISGSLKVDQSSLTGESREIEKRPSKEKKNSPDSSSAIFRGCPILSGECEAEIFAVGASTLLGEISKEVQTDTRTSPLKLRLAKLAKQISRIGYVAALLIALVSLFKTFIIDSGFNAELIASKIHDIPYLLEHLLSAFMLALTVLVMAVPEGLPMMIAVVLSSNIKRMLRDNVLVRKAVGIEAAGSMNILFTDKTGTLTEGKMCVSNLLSADGYEFPDFTMLKKRAPVLARLYSLSCRHNTSSTVSGIRALGGNATERALLESVIRSGLGFEGEACETLSRLPFDSARKYSAACVRSGSTTMTLVKGAPEILLSHTTHTLTRSGEKVAFDGALREKFCKRLEELSDKGARMLLVAFSEGSAKLSDGLPSNLTLVLALSLEDKIRPEAKRSVRSLREAGIQVVMITGDSAKTAQSIGERCGIVNKNTPLVLDGRSLSALSDDELKKILPRLAVVARVLPSDKSRLVRIAQECELVVGMTGDGINDAPALRRADIGFSMGSGTQVAKDAGDIIILDDDLASIANAVLYGRTVFKSIRKFITLQLTMNFSAVGISMIAPFLGFSTPVTVVQMLWINIIMDTLGGLAFAGEAPKAHYMKEKPKRRDEPILCRYMIEQIVYLCAYSVFLCLVFLGMPSFRAHFRHSPDNIYLLTAFFALFIFASVFNCFNCRTDRLKLFSGLSENRAFIFIMLLVGAIQIVFTYLGGSILRTAPLLFVELLYTFLLSLTVLPADLVRKTLRRIFGRKDGF